MKCSFQHAALRLFITLQLFCAKNGKFIALQNEGFQPFSETETCNGNFSIGFANDGPFSNEKANYCPNSLSL